MTTLSEAEIAEGRRLLAYAVENEFTARVQECQDWLYDHAEALLTGYAELQFDLAEWQADFAGLQAEIERLETELTTLRGKWEPA